MYKIIKNPLAVENLYYLRYENYKFGLIMVLLKFILATGGNNMKCKIIMINGVSSTGKTTLANELHKNLNEPFYVISKDDFGKLIPYKEGDFRIYASMVSLSLYNTIKIIANHNYNVIIDTLFQERPEFSGMLKECVFLLREYPVMFIKTICPIDELRRREASRDDSVIGKAEAQLEYLVPNNNAYDLILDTYNNNLQHNIKLVKEKLTKVDEWSAFNELIKYYDK